jgi:hypothetical protein
VRRLQPAPWEGGLQSAASADRDCNSTARGSAWVLRAPGQPAATRSHTWHKGTSGESLRQKLEHIVWSLEDEEALTLTDVITGLRTTFDRDKVSKKFYDRFKTEHQAFSGFISGLEQARAQCKDAFEGESSVWPLLAADPDRYLYPAMKTGVVDAVGTVVADSVLPDFVQIGMHDPKACMFDRRYNLRLR